MYFLSRDCFVCKMGCYWIVLSARRDRYLCVAHNELVSIGHLLHGWAHLDSPLTQSLSLGDEVNTLIRSLISNEIITSTAANGKAFAEFEYPAPETSLEAPEQFPSPHLPFLSIVRFFVACGTVDWRLRTEPLPRTLARIDRRRQRVNSKATNHGASHAAQLVAAFKSLRPLYPRSYLCLFDSLAMLEFLALFHCFPRMVFGVVADPFEAHCWLQEGPTVLNDVLECVGRFKSILSV